MGPRDGPALFCFSIPLFCMPFDPTKPANAANIVAEELRDQFNSLKTLIDNAGTALDAGIAGTAQNPSMGTLSIALSDPPTRAEVQQILDAFNALLNQIIRV